MPEKLSEEERKQVLGEIMNDLIFGDTVGKTEPKIDTNNWLKIID